MPFLKMEATNWELPLSEAEMEERWWTILLVIMKNKKLSFLLTFILRVK